MAVAAVAAAPVAARAAAWAGSTPPMATIGSGATARTAAARPASPTTGSGRSLLGVAKTGPKPR